MANFSNPLPFTLADSIQESSHRLEDVYYRVQVLILDVLRALS